MSSPGFDGRFAKSLADAFVAGDWAFDSVLERGVGVLRRRGRWLKPLVERIISTFPEGHRPGSKAVAAFLIEDHGFRRACQRLRPALRYDKWPPPTMSAFEGVPSSWDVPALNTPGELAAFLEVEPARLDWLADAGGFLARAERGPLRHYRYEWRAKRSGEPRLIESPKPELKRLQRRILSEILDKIPPHDAAHGFRAGRSIVTFCRPHAARAVVLKMDLRNFFTSISASRIQSIYRVAGYPEAVARILSGLCTSTTPRDVIRAAGNHADNGLFKMRALNVQYGRRHLPQGAPTSPALANLAAYRLDLRLSGLARAAGGDYTRYADDLAFSGDQSFARKIDRFSTHVAAVAIEEGFALHHRKTHIMRLGTRQQVAGIVVNERLNVPRREFDRLKAILHNCLRKGPEGQNRLNVDDFRAHLAGRIGFAAMVNPEKGRRLKEMFDRVNW